MVAHTPHLTFSYLLRRRRKMDFIKNLDWQLIYTVVFRTLLAVIVGALIGSERAKHGRAVGKNNHLGCFLPQSFWIAPSLFESLPLVYQNLKQKRHPLGCLSCLARGEGLEPPTFWFVAKHSIRLSYQRICFLLP